MEVKNLSKSASPPRLIPSFLAGFNSVASHIQLIIPPILLDLIIWFAPRLRIKTLFNPLIEQYTQFILASGSPEVQTIIKNSQTLWEETLSRFNLLSLLHTLPIGVPSLLAGRGVVETPVGNPAFFEVPSFALLFGVWLIFVIIGMAAGSLFFGEIARLCLDQQNPLSVRRFFKLFKHTIFFTISTYLVIFILSIPIALILTVISLISPVFTQIAIIFISLILIWLLMPLIFSPHGIYSFEQNVFTAAINSIRLVRYFLPGTGVFLLMAILISQGMDILWSLPPEASWMTMIGIFGHAFVVTGLIASSFIYYRGGIQWMNEKLKRFAGNESTSSNPD